MLGVFPADDGQHDYTTVTESNCDSGITSGRLSTHAAPSGYQQPSSSVNSAYINEPDNNATGFEYQYNEDSLQFNEDMSDVTLSRLEHHWESTYDPTTNTYCSTRIERYYTRTYN